MSRHRNQDTNTPFGGFHSPNYTIVPDQLFDELLADLSGGEVKVLLYVVRHTFGWKKDSDSISLSQLCKGITTRDGKVIDRGTGLSESTVLQAVKGLLSKNVLVARRQFSAERGHEPTVYSLNVITPFPENRGHKIQRYKI